MNISLQHNHYYPCVLSGLSLCRTLNSASAKEFDLIRRRRGALRKVDIQLSRGNFKNALILVKKLQGRRGGLRGFGAAKLVPRRIMSLDELNLSEMETSYVRSLMNSMMDSVRNSLTEQVPGEKSTDGEVDNSYSKESLMCLQHEAGHFLMGYLLGVLPTDYSIFREENNKINGGRVGFPSFELFDEVDIEKRRKDKLSKRTNMRKISLTKLNRFLCVILGGLAAEHLGFGYAEGFHTDLEKMEEVFRWLDFTEEEVESQVRWATLNTILILRWQEEARLRLADAMGLEESVGRCIDTIENHLNENEIN